ncbi:hypothetical protein AB0F88_36035 [Streptosporangium sp. NPDC023963]|uniref:hypothetical protein n=1 Tax=Streptosporangium sp. NPDC023963 TaxID=3155608 RepID=UPI0034191317
MIGDRLAGGAGEGPSATACGRHRSTHIGAQAAGHGGSPERGRRDGPPLPPSGEPFLVPGFARAGLAKLTAEPPPAHLDPRAAPLV